MDNNDMKGSSSSSSDVDLEILETDACGDKHIGTYSVKHLIASLHKKRLICFSTINDEECSYGHKCIYAHSLTEQSIDTNRKLLYKIILDEHLMAMFPSSSYDAEYTYNQLMFATYLCKKCKDNKCTGGYNCKHGVNMTELKICRDNLMTGHCKNSTIFVMDIDKTIFDKVLDGGKYNAAKCIACKDGHHLTHRGLVPYNKYKQDLENANRRVVQSIRYIDGHISDNIIDNRISYDSSTDDEIDQCFKMKYATSWSSSDDD